MGGGNYGVGIYTQWLTLFDTLILPNFYKTNEDFHRNIFTINGQNISRLVTSIFSDGRLAFK